MGEPATRADAFLRVATIAFVIGWALDAVDHLRRGFAAAPLTLTYLAATHAVLIAVAVTMILRHRRHAPEATVIVGSASVLGLGYCTSCRVTGPPYKTASSPGHASTSPGSRG
ncbi:Uncharacterised protein [Mycobacteroides abscessus subsp. massiliense]|nr:Uncharacterised protein [Mycobacteroides abscessus subsp. massiliense]